MKSYWLMVCLALAPFASTLAKPPPPPPPKKVQHVVVKAPPRPHDAFNCPKCDGRGWTRTWYTMGFGHRKCQHCEGLGWLVRPKMPQHPKKPQAHSKPQPKPQPHHR